MEGAITDYTDVIRLDPKNVTAYHARGLAWNVVGNTERAIADLTEAARLNPLNLDVVAALKILKPDYQAKVDMLKLLDE